MTDFSQGLSDIISCLDEVRAWLSSQSPYDRVEVWMQLLNYWNYMFASSQQNTAQVIFQTKLVHFGLQIFLVLVMLSVVVQAYLHFPCKARQQLVPERLLRRLRKYFYFVKLADSLMKNVLRLPGRRLRRDTLFDIVGTSLCPWRWTQDDDLTRIPRFGIPQAVCPPSGRVLTFAALWNSAPTELLVQRPCDATTGDKVWKWPEKELEIAFLYGP